MILYRLVTAKEAELYKNGKVPPIKESRYDDATDFTHRYQNKELKSGECLYFFGNIHYIMAWYEELRWYVSNERDEAEKTAKEFFEKLQENNDTVTTQDIIDRRSLRYMKTKRYYARTLGGKLKDNELEKEHYEEIISQMQKREEEMSRVSEKSNEKRKRLIEKCISESNNGIINLPEYGIENFDLSNNSKEEKEKLIDLLLSYVRCSVDEDYSIIKVDIPKEAEKLIDYGDGHYPFAKEYLPEYRIKKEDFKVEWITAKEKMIEVFDLYETDIWLSNDLYEMGLEDNYQKMMIQLKNIYAKMGEKLGAGKDFFECGANNSKYVLPNSLYKEGEEHIRLLNGKRLNYSNIGRELDWMKGNENIDYILELLNDKLGESKGEEIVFGADEIHPCATVGEKLKQTLKEKNEIYYSDLVPANLLNRIYNKYGREILEKTITQDMDVEQMVATINLLATGNIDFPHRYVDEQTKKPRYFDDKVALEIVMQGLDSEKINEIKLKQEEMEPLPEVEEKGSKEVSINLLRELREEKYNLEQEGNDLAKQLEELEKGQDVGER